MDLRSGDLRIVATHDLGSMGLASSEPVLIAWRWYYQIPGLAIWPLIVLLLLLPENRRLQIWLILVPLLLVVLGIEALNAMVGADGAGGEGVAIFFTTLAASWTAVWLLADRLLRRRAIAAMALAAGVMLLIGIVARLWASGLSPAGGGLLAAFYCDAAVALIGATALAARCCRRWDHLGVFAAWLLLWLPVAGILATLGVFLPFMLVMEPGSREVASNPGLLILVGSQVAVIGLVLAAAIYLLNLPFLILARACPAWRARIRRLWWQEPLTVESVSTEGVPSGENPFAS